MERINPKGLKQKFPLDGSLVSGFSTIGIDFIDKHHSLPDLLEHPTYAHHLHFPEIG